MADSFVPDSFQAEKGSDSFVPEVVKPKTYTQGFFKTYDESKNGGFLKRMDVSLAKTVKTGFDVLSAPFEVLGEAVTAPIEQAGQWIKGGPGAVTRTLRNPSIVQEGSQVLNKMVGTPDLTTPEPPANPFSTVNRLLRAGAGAFSTLPGMGGTGSPVDAAVNAYNAPRGTMGTVEDTGLGLLAGKMAPEPMGALVDAPISAIVKTAQGAEKLGSAIKAPLAWGGKKLINVGLSIPEEAQTILRTRAPDVARQTTFPGLADKLSETTNALQTNLTNLDSAAWDTLPPEQLIPKQKIVNIFDKVKQDFIGQGGTKISDADKAAVAQIDTYINRVKGINAPSMEAGNPLGIPETDLSAPQLKDVIQSVQKDATYGLVRNEPINRAVKSVRAAIDSELKTNPDYKAAMIPVKQATSALDETIDKFGLQRDPETGNLVPTKKTIDRLVALQKGKTPELARTVDSLKNATGIDFADESKLTAIKALFEKADRTRGSARTNLGAVTGAGLGSTIGNIAVPGGIGMAGGASLGAGLGGWVGRTADMYSGPIAKRLIEMMGSASPTGNVLNAVNAPTATPIQELIRRIMAGQPGIAPMIRGNQQ